MADLDLDLHALADEVAILLTEERKKPYNKRKSFREITGLVYRSHNIRGELWGVYNSAIGKILASRPRKHGLQKNTRPPMKTARIVKIEASPKHLSLVLDGKYEVLFTPTDKGGVSASTTCLRKPCKQSHVPQDLLADARAIAKRHFAGNKNLELDLRPRR